MTSDQQQHLQERLNQIPGKILSDEFLQARGLGNELAFWVFDYDPAAELQVREYSRFLLELLRTKHTQLKVAHIDLFKSLMGYLEDRGFLTKALAMQAAKGDAGAYQGAGRTAAYEQVCALSHGAKPGGGQ